ncbi:MAG: NAD-glutamate dehydrogenase, partial [Gammaproteobacteria bacterium]
MATKKAANTRKPDDLFTQIVTASKQSPHRPFDTSLCEDFLRLYYSDVNIEDLKDYAPEDLAYAALSHLTLGSKRKPRDIRVRVYNPQPKTDGWRSLHTIIETVTVDMPFLVDSITMAAQKHGLSVHQTTHPIIAVQRNDNTSEAEAFSSQGSFTDSDESFVHLEVDRISGSDKLERIQRDIGRSLKDTAAAVHDWTAMRDRAESLAYELDPAT